ncbi:DNA-binding protein [Deltaproteobacteria bacterium Smac51]|nr:DNA-binding protein [Deltaproteobacteria bacterium Smac51]
MTMSRIEPEILNWAQACKIICCSKSHFYNLTNSGKIPFFRVGRQKGIRVRRTDCEKYMQSKLNQEPAEQLENNPAD